MSTYYNPYTVWYTPAPAWYPPYAPVPYGPRPFVAGFVPAPVVIWR